jgi:hypothetical protein
MSKTTVPPISQMNASIESWIFNTRQVLTFPVTILSVAGLLVLGTFAESAPRKSLEFLDNYLGHSLFFIVPFIFSVFLDWPTGLLAAVVSLILFTRLQKYEVSEGFVNDTLTELVPSSKRWFVERVLDETPIAISNDRIRAAAYKDDDTRTSSSSSMASIVTSDGSSHK